MTVCGQSSKAVPFVQFQQIRWFLSSLSSLNDKSKMLFSPFSENFSKILESDEKAIETSPLLVVWFTILLYFLLAMLLSSYLPCCCLVWCIVLCLACLYYLHCLLVLLFGQLAACLLMLFEQLAAVWNMFWPCCLHIFTCLGNLVVFG